MKSWVKELKMWIYQYKMMPNDTYTSVIRTGTIQEDPRTMQALKSVEKAFEQQAESISARTLKPHDSNCDTINCISDPCFIKSPDSIVKTSEFKIPKNRRTRISMGRFQK